MGALRRLGSAVLGRGAGAVVLAGADRPLLFSRDAEEVQANRPGCAAYLLAVRNDAWARQIAESLSRRHPVIPVGDHHLIFLLPVPP